MKKGLLLVNLGTPEAPNVSAVRKYLREFLQDKYVIDVPTIIRFILVNFLIIPLRAKKSTRAYQEIWTTKGSPLLVHSLDLCKKLQQSLDDYEVSIAMRYGEPSIAKAISQLKDCSHITVFPLYPQYAQATTFSSIEFIKKYLASQNLSPKLKIINNFYDDPSFIKAQAELIKPYINNHNHLLLSYHGLPTRQLQKVGCPNECEGICGLETNQNKLCYRRQCFATSKAIANYLKLQENQYTTSFQSRLGKTPWIRPYTDETINKLATKGIKRLAVSCPSFTADCLETLEEIGIQANDQWQKLGGEKLTLIPALNSEDFWVKAIANII